MFTPTSTKLDPIVEKALLLAIEKQNQPRTNIVLLDLCDANSDLFGEKGTKQRRDVQMYWNNIRRRSIRSYCKLLERWGVKMNDTTASLLQEEGRCPSPDSSTTMSGESFCDDEEVNEDDCNVDDICGELNKSLSLGSCTTPIARHHVQQIPTHPPSTLLPQMSSNSDSNMWQGGMIGSPAPSLTFSSDSSTAGEARKGTQASPIVIKVDLVNSEQNFPFDIIRVPRIEHGGWAREGIDIRLAIGVGDADCWEAWMDDSVPELQDHAIMIRGRSRSSDYDALDSYHRDDKQSDTAAVHNKQKEAIQRDPSRQTLYWRIVTPRSMPLDNVILSGDSTMIARKEKGVKRTVGEDEGLVVLSYFVSWVIAKKKRAIRFRLLERFFSKMPLLR